MTLGAFAAKLAKGSDLTVCVALVLAAAVACVSAPKVQRAVKTFDVAAFLVAINEAALGMAPEDNGTD